MKLVVPAARSYRDHGELLITFSLRKQLAAFLLLVAVLLAPLSSIAHDAASAAADTCACSLMLDDAGSCTLDRSDGGPEDGGQDCCDCEDHCTQAAELLFFGYLSVYIPDKQLFHPVTQVLIPEVYLAIVVPPQICCFG
jgi:hypothetical protein